jgi:hypothetical protein
MESIAGCKRGEFVRGMCNLWGPIYKLVCSFHRLYTKCRVCAVLNEVSSGTWLEMYCHHSHRGTKESHITFIMRACSKFGLYSQIGPSEMLMPVYRSAWYHIPEDYNFNIYGHEKLTFHV